MRLLTRDRDDEHGRERSSEQFTCTISAGRPHASPVRESSRLMNGDIRRGFERGRRVVHVNDTQPDTDPGGAQSAEKVKAIIHEMEAVDGEQRAGLLDVHAAALEKRKLRVQIVNGPIAHLSEVGKLASREDHQLATTFRIKPSGDSYVTVRTAAGTMKAEAEAHKDVLLRHGLSEPVLVLLGELLEKFDAAMALGVAGRSRHKGATKQLGSLAQELGALVRVMDARNRQRFQDSPELLEAWISASKLQARQSGKPEERAGPPVQEGGAQDRPAA